MYLANLACDLGQALVRLFTCSLGRDRMIFRMTKVSPIRTTTTKISPARVVSIGYFLHGIVVPGRCSVRAARAWSDAPPVCLWHLGARGIDHCGCYDSPGNSVRLENSRGTGE